MQFSSILLFVLALSCVSTDVKAMENLMGTEMQKCLNCLCHARSGCWSRFNCARYSISKNYWKKAGSPSIGAHSNSDEAYKSCMHNENCILNTIKSYTKAFGEIDCNCDGEFNCKDMFAMHIFGEDCTNPKYGETYATRFNECHEEVGVSAMSPVEGDCAAEEFK